MAESNTNTVINTDTARMTEKQKVKEITDRLEEGLKELFESEKYKAYLSTMSKFHNYSFNNIQLIAMQKPDATLVAGYRAWQKNFERHVNKGEKAIRILAPAPYKIKEEQDKLDPVTGELMFDENGMPQKEEVEIKIPAFRVVSVFDVSQTDGKPIPELEAQELFSAVEGYEDFIKAITAVAPAPVGFEDIPGDSKGYFNMAGNRIAVQEGMSESQTLKTMVHETAHSMLHNKEVSKEDISAPAKDRNTKEVEAESIAYTVCQHFGIDTSDYSFGYIAGWSSGKDMKELKSSLDTIRKTASELITGIEEQLREIQLDREMMQDMSINGQEKESLLLIQNRELSEYSLVSVRGMGAAQIVEALSAMNDNDRLNAAAYLESRGAWTTEIANEETRGFGEYRLDVRYITDTNEIIDLKAAMEWNEKETQLLYGSTDRYGIYQLKDNPELDQLRFEGTEALKRRGITKYNLDAVRAENYDLVYVGELSELSKDFTGLQTQGDTLEALYEKFNIDRPEDFKGHSLSVSDIVVLHENGKNSAHFVDSFGFTGLPDFMREMEDIKEQEADKAENELTDEEKQFLETDNAPLIAKKFLAWDEIEDLGYCFFEDGYIDRFKPSEKALYGDGCVPEPEIYDIARRMQGGGDIREELAKALIGDYEQVMEVGENNAVAVFGNHAVTVTFGNAEKQISYEEMGTAFLGLIESEYKDIEQARAAEEQAEEIAGNVTSGHDVQKSEPEQPQAEQSGQRETEHGAETPDLADMEDGDEIIDLGDEREQVLAEMKKAKEQVQDTSGQNVQKPETELADDIKGENAQSGVVADFKAKTRELFHEISEMDPAEIEETVKCHVQAQLDEYGIDARIVDAAVVGSRCRGLEREGSDLDVVVELSTNEREDVLFDMFHEDGLCIGGVKVDINPITVQRTGSLETYLPQVEDYLEGVWQAREQEQMQRSQGNTGRKETEVTPTVPECVTKPSLKARLAEKKAQVAGQGKDHDAQENNKNNQREM